MLFNESKTCGYRQGLRVVALLVFCLSATLRAQAPDPSQTVNPATGEMTVAIPLGEIAGVGKLGYSANLNYHAGITTSEEASPAGLGFGFLPGAVTRKVVYVPDDNSGGSGSYVEESVRNDCDNPPWKYVFAIVMAVVAIVLIIVAPYLAPEAAALATSFIITGIGGLMGSVFTLSSLMNVEYNGLNFLGGGAHDDAYSAFATEQGRGYLKGATGDLPDIYFLNTPYINGMIRPKGPAVGGKAEFALVVADGKPGSKAKIYYDTTKKEFEIHMEDGSRIFLGGTDASVLRNTMSTTKVWTSMEQDETECYNDRRIEQRENVPSAWLLRKVLGPDYDDEDTDDDPLTNPKLAKGAWLAFCYGKVPAVNARRLPMSAQGGPKTTIIMHSGYEGHYTFEESYLDSIRTPLGKVHYVYTQGRLDDLWFNPAHFTEWYRGGRNTEGGPYPPPAMRMAATTADVQPIDRKVLDRVVFYNVNNTVMRTAVLKTSYRLRPNSFYSMKKNMDGTWGAVDAVKNPNKACLTLDGITIYDNAMGDMTTTNFYYDYNPDGIDITKINVPDGSPLPVKFFIEQRDGWGYYLRNIGTSNDFNFNGAFLKSVDPTTGQTYAAAWSMTSMYMPSGLRLAWEYESNRYDLCNARAVTSIGDEPRYAGGPRVKKAILDPSGNSKPTTVSYFYTSGDNFEENITNSSGHASIEPVPFLDEHDTRNDATKGSFYTPTKVCYRSVKIVKNYIPPAVDGEDGQAPLGYTNNYYITSSRFPNNGQYGQIDESWRRGFLDSIVQYNASRIPVHKAANYYRWIPNMRFSSVNNTYLTGGTVQLIRQTDTANGVGTEVKHTYADSVANAGSDADPMSFVRKPINYAISPAIWNTRFCNREPLPPILPQGFTVRGSFIGNAGETYKDIVAVLHQGAEDGVNNYQDYINVLVVWDYDKPNTAPPAFSSLFQFHIGDAIHSNDRYMQRQRQGLLQYEDIKLYIHPDPMNSTKIDIYVTFRLSEMYRLNDGSPGGRITSNYGLHYLKIDDVTRTSGTEIRGDYLIDISGAMPPVTLNPVERIGNPDYNYHRINFTKHTRYDDETGSSYFEHGPDFIDCLETLILDRDGRPNRTITINSNGDTLIKEIVPAFTQTAYSAMVTNNNNILAPVSQATTFGKKKATGTPTEPYVVSAQSTKWSKTAGTPAWMPCSSYIWKADFRDDGTPDRTFWYFDFNPGATNPNWQYTGSVTRYNPNSQPLETGKPTPTGNQSLSAMVYGHGNVLPVGSITNANFLECGVFTCDYDQNELYNGNYYFDKANGWEKCGSVLSTTKKHFGEKTVYANLPAGTTAFGPSRNVALSYNTDYVFSAWVLVVSGELVINGNYRGRTNSENPILPNEMNRSFSVPAIRVPAATQWQYVELKIPASTDLPFNIWRLNNGAWAARVYIGEPNGVEAYIDDIRFAPKKAFVTTTYYDQLWRQPVISVDANNKPGKKVTFDSFGRPVQWDKINPSKSVGDAGYATTLQRKAYHIRNELLEGENIQVFLPNGGETFTAEHIMNIHWSSRVAGDVTISYQNADGSDPHNITSAPIVNQQGYGTYEWTIPDDAIGTNRVIKVSSTAAGGCNDASDAPFTIVQNKFGPLTYLSPSNGANVGPGSNVTLSWKGSGYTTGVISYRVWFRDNMLNVYTWDTENTSLVVSSGYGESRWNVTPIKDGIVGPTGPTWIFIKSIGM